MTTLGVYFSVPVHCFRPLLVSRVRFSLKTRPFPRAGRERKREVDAFLCPWMCSFCSALPTVLGKAKHRSVFLKKNCLLRLQTTGDTPVVGRRWHLVGRRKVSCNFHFLLVFHIHYFVCRKKLMRLDEPPPHIGEGQTQEAGWLRRFSALRSVLVCRSARNSPTRSKPAAHEYNCFSTRFDASQQECRGGISPGNWRDRRIWWRTVSSTKKINASKTSIAAAHI